MSLRLLLFLTCINTLNYLDRYLLSAVLPLVLTHFALSDEQGGRLISAFVLGYALFSPIFGVLGDHLRRPILMSLAVAFWSVATISSGLVSTYSALFAVRALVGVGEAGFTAIAPGYIKDHISNPAKLNWALSIFFTAIPVGSALGYVLGGVISAHWSWQAVFWVGGVPGLLLALALLKLPEAPAKAKLEQDRSAKRELIFQIIRQPVLLYAIMGYVLNAFALAGIAAFVSKYGMQIGFGVDEINTAFGIVLVVTGLVGTLAGGRLAGRISKNSPNPTHSMLRLVGVLSLIGAPCVAFAFVSSDHLVFLVACFLAELFIFGAIAPVNTVIVLSSPPTHVNFVQGLTILCLNLGGALSAPILVGLVSDRYGLALALQLCSVALLGSGLVWIVGGRKGKNFQAK